MENQQLVDAFKSSKKKFEIKQKEIEDYITKNSSKELGELNLAYEKYQKKIDTLQKSDKFSKLDNELKNHSASVQKHLKTAIKVFDKERDKIMTGGGSQEEKNNKISKVYDYMLSKLFSPEEVKLFKTMRGKVVYLLE